ncbi:MAG TPA: HAD family hydrolase [Deinococcales bacterium]|nr:HAD family hydrolase [Deinococcales bacterium]
MIGLILIDVDGTYVGRGAVVHPDIPLALQEARDRGVKLALCTGRPAYSLAGDYARAVAPNGLHIFQNGAAVNAADGTAAHIEELPRDAYAGMVELSRADARPLEVYTARALHIERQDALTRRHAELLGTEPVVTDLLTLPDPPVRVQWVVRMDDLPEVQEKTARFPDLELNWAQQMDMADVAFASVTRRGTSKVSAAEWLAGHYGLTLQAVAMVGDGLGDLEIVRAAGFGIAMGNAEPEVKAAAKAVVGDVNDGGLAEAVRLALRA